MGLTCVVHPAASGVTALELTPSQGVEFRIAFGPGSPPVANRPARKLQANQVTVCSQVVIFRVARIMIISVSRMHKLTIILVAAFVGLCSAYGPLRTFFPATSLLKCMLPNPLAGRPGEPDTKLEPIPTIGFHLNVTENGTFLYPMKSGCVCFLSRVYVG